jgi:hypothetical protein
MESEAEKMRTACRAWWNDGDWIITLAEAGCVNITRIDPTHWALLKNRASLARSDCLAGKTVLGHF